METQRLREYLRDLEAAALVPLDWPHGQPLRVSPFEVSTPSTNAAS